MTIKGYHFYIREVTDPPSEWRRVTDVPMSYVDFVYTGLDSATEYEFASVAVDAGNNQSTMSAALRASTLTYETLDAPMSSEDSTPIDKLVNDAIDSYKGGGISGGCLLGIVGPKGTYYKAYGSAYGRALTLDDKMRYGSITKMATATLILAQIDAGHISFDDKLSKFVSGVPNGDIITIKQMLMMRAGIRDYIQQDPTVSQSYFLNPTATFDPIPYIKSYAPLYKPDLGFNYSNSCYVLLGKVLEWCDDQYGTSRDARTIVLEDFLVPFGMTESEWPTGSYMSQPYSRGWAINAAYQMIVTTVNSLPLAGMLGWLYWMLVPMIAPGIPLTPTVEFTAASTTWGGTAGALDGTIHDLVKFGVGLRDGTLLSSNMKQAREETFNTYIIYTPTAAWMGSGWSGAGLGVMEFGTWQGWVGNLAGYHSSLFYNIESKAVIAIMFNEMDASSYNLFLQIAYQLFPDSLDAAEWKLRVNTGMAATDTFAKGWAYNWHVIGDSDGVTQLPHKVGYYL